MTPVDFLDRIIRPGCMITGMMRLRSLGTRSIHAMNVLLGNDLAELRLQSMQVCLHDMARQMNHLHDRLNEQTKLMRKIHEMTENDP